MNNSEKIEQLILHVSVLWILVIVLIIGLLGVYFGPIDTTSNDLLNVSNRLDIIENDLLSVQIKLEIQKKQKCIDQGGDYSQSGILVQGLKHIVLNGSCIIKNHVYSYDGNQWSKSDGKVPIEPPKFNIIHATSGCDGHVCTDF